jgi:hypothetical protein
MGLVAQEELAGTRGALASAKDDTAREKDRALSAVRELEALRRKVGGGRVCGWAAGMRGAAVRGKGTARLAVGEGGGCRHLACCCVGAWARGPRQAVGSRVLRAAARAAVRGGAAAGR